VATRPGPPPPDIPLILTSVQAIPDTGVAYTLCLPATGHANIAFDPLGGGGHFDTLQVVHLDAADDTVTRCGDLTFANQVHTFDVLVVNACGDQLCPYLYWWRGSRSRSTGQYASASLWDGTLEEHDTVEIENRPMPLETQYDGVGAILLKATSPHTVTDSAFLGLGDYAHDIQYRIRYWRHVDSLVLDSATVNGYVVTLWWQNRHQGRAIDSTIIFRDGHERARLGHTADRLPDTVPGFGTYQYRLKHFSTAVVGGASLASPNSPPWTLQVTPNAPPTAGFIVSCQQLPCGFTDTSADPDGSIVSWAWTFGDGDSWAPPWSSPRSRANGTPTRGAAVAG
jgi:hypothetical protein